MDAAAQLKAHPADWGLVWINAGVGVGAPMIGGQPAAIEWGFGVNVLGAIWTAQAFLPLCLKAPACAISAFLPRLALPWPRRKRR